MKRAVLLLVLLRVSVAHAEDPQGPLRLEGQVVGPYGKAVFGAEVWLSSVPPRSTITDADGGFSFDMLVGRAYSVLASTPDLVGGPIRFTLSSTSGPVIIRMTKAAALNVKVVDPEAHPVAGATVKVQGLGEQAASTNARGAVKLQPVRPGWVPIEATATGYALGLAFATVGSAGAAGEVTIVLRKGVTVAGRVTDDHGEPIRAHVSVGDGSPWGFGREADEVETDANGQFTFPAIAPGAHVLLAVDGEHEPAKSTLITVADRATAGVDIVMKAGGAISGIVVDADGNPARNATVRVAGIGARMWMVSRQATTDASGRFELRGLARSTLQARAESDGSASKLVETDLTSQVIVRDLRLVLDVKGTIAGTVVDDHDQPVTEAQVNAFPELYGGAPEGPVRAGMSSATTDGAGRFTIHGLPDGSYRLWAGRTGEIEDGWGMQSRGARTGASAVRIVLPTPGQLVGKIVLDGNPAPMLASVQVGRHAPMPARGGVFVVKDLPSNIYDTYDVTFRGPEFAEYVRHGVVITANKTTDLGTIRVPRGRTLKGRVVDGNGAPVAGATLKLGDVLFSSSDGDADPAAKLDELGEIRSSSTDQDGKFLIVGISQSATTVIADHPDRGRSRAIAIPEGTEDPPAMTLALRGFGSIIGTVTMDGHAQGNATISESSEGGGAQFTQTAADGTFTLAKVPEGSHVVKAMWSQVMAGSVTAQVTAGQQTAVAIDIPLGTSAPVADERTEVLPRVGAGLEVATGIYTGLVGFRGRFALDHILAVRTPEPRLSVGLTFGFGQFYNDSEPKSGMRHQYNYGSVGPEVMYVLDSVGDDQDVRVFAAAALVNTWFEHQYGDRTDGWGGRISIGLNAAARMWRQVDEGMRHDKCDMGSSGGCGAPFVIMALPHQFELTAEHDHGTTRVGMVIGYGY